MWKGQSKKPIVLSDISITVKLNINFKNVLEVIISLIHLV